MWTISSFRACCVERSCGVSITHARILRIDTSRAERLPGLKEVVTGGDLPFLHGESIMDEPFLARKKGRYLGEAVAVVAATDGETAEKALNLSRMMRWAIGIVQNDRPIL